MISGTTAAWTAAGICAIAAALEGLCAGRGVSAFFRTLRFPRYSAPLWVWSIIGAVYYLVFGFVLYRLLAEVPHSLLATGTLTLVLSMMLGNALTNVVIFRLRNLDLSHVIGCVFAALDAVLLWCLIRLDRVAAASLAPYLLYRLYAVWWGYALAKLNR